MMRLDSEANLAIDAADREESRTSTGMSIDSSAPPPRLRVLIIRRTQRSNGPCASLGIRRPRLHGC